MDSIEMAAPHPAWREAFALERHGIEKALAALRPLAIAHIGSTAVAGVPAKPIIDIMALAPSLAAARDLYPSALAALGYEFWAENPDAERLFFVKGRPPRGAGRTHHLHVVQSAALFARHTGFRDLLAADAGVAEAYGALKAELAVRHAEDRERYTEGKSLFIAEALAAAGARSAFALPIGRAEIGRLIPHAGAMSLIEEVLVVDAGLIVARATSHRAPDNPLRRAGELPAVCGVEYAAQAAALHARLTTPPGTEGAPRNEMGLLAVLRSVSWLCDRLDDVEGDLYLRAEPIVASPGGRHYSFEIRDETTTLVAGELIVAFPMAG